MILSIVLHKASLTHSKHIFCFSFCCAGSKKLCHDVKERESPFPSKITSAQIMKLFPGEHGIISLLCPISLQMNRPGDFTCVCRKRSSAVRYVLEIVSFFSRVSSICSILQCKRSFINSSKLSCFISMQCGRPCSCACVCVCTHICVCVCFLRMSAFVCKCTCVCVMKQP